jgi:hypothetical protein
MDKADNKSEKHTFLVLLKKLTKKITKSRDKTLGLSVCIQVLGGNADKK